MQQARLITLLLSVVALFFAIPAHAATMTCKPSYRDFFEFECRSQEPAINAASFCDVMNRQGGAFRWSRSDTYDTKARADTINAVGKKLCGWGRK